MWRRDIAVCVKEPVATNTVIESLISKVKSLARNEYIKELFDDNRGTERNVPDVNT